MTAALEGGEWSAARLGRTLPPGKTRYPLYRRLGGPQSRSGRSENLVLTGILSRTVQPVVSRYTEWAARLTYLYVCVCVCIYIYGNCFQLFIPLHQVAELSRQHNVCMYQCLHMPAGITQRGRCSYLLPDTVLSGGTAVPMKTTACIHSQLLSMLACVVSINYQSWVCNPSHCSCVARMW